MRSDPIRLLLVETRTLVRAAMGCLLQTRPEIRVVGQAESLTQALALAAQHLPHLVLLSPDLEAGLGAEAVPHLLAAAGPQARVLLVSETEDADWCRQALRQGAHGVVGTDRPPETLFKAIEKVWLGEVWMERRIVAGMLGAEPALTGERARIESLTRREREVVSLVCQGLRNKQIADRLTVTDVTVRHHLTSVFSKLGVTDRLSLLIYATRHGFSSAPVRPPRSG